MYILYIYTFFCTHIPSILKKTRLGIGGNSAVNPQLGGDGLVRRWLWIDMD